MGPRGLAGECENDAKRRQAVDKEPLRRGTAQPTSKSRTEVRAANFETRAVASDAKFEPPPTHFTCVRCGNFVETYQPGLEACADCVEKVLPDGVRGPISFVTVVNGVAHLTLKLGVRAALLAFLFRIPGSVLFAFAPGAYALLRFAYEIIPLMADTAIMVMAHECLLGRKITLHDAFSRAGSRYFVVFRARYLSSFFIFLWSLLLIVPGVFKTLAYSLAEPIALFENENASASIEASGERTDPHYGVLALTYGVTYLTTTVWVISIPALGQLAHEFLAENQVENSIDLVPIALILGDITSSLFMILVVFVQVVVYTKIWLGIKRDESLKRQ